jgi:hypothetical protein
MLDVFLKYAGPLQAFLGAGGAAIPDLSNALGTGMGGNLFNLLSGAVASYLGLKAGPVAQQRGAQLLGMANTLIGVLSAAGVYQATGFGVQQGNVATIISLALGLWGLAAGFLNRQQEDFVGRASRR